MNYNGHRLTENVKLLQKIVVVDDDQVLLVRRSPDAFYRPSAWDLPGGNAEWPTAETDTVDLHKLDAVRELAEETGISVESTQIGEQPIYFGTYFEGERELFTMIVGWKVELPESFDQAAVKLSDEHIAFVWANFDQLGDYDFGFAGDKDGFIGRMLRNAR